MNNDWVSYHKGETLRGTFVPTKSRYSSRLDTVCKRLVSTDHFDQNFEGPALLVCMVIITMLMNGDRVSSNSRPLF
ncbi:hypothetical protein DPX16_9984 [Anabarilius grahami]|uniref:Uncharacterized protein n=1 Tax=Anabarilius grahami TaxID=495550 RepID=A0A3N0XWK8_ANAGA|nr:hypothetical protein DPX16_9984 [Anabarilius grahami]